MVVTLCHISRSFLFLYLIFINSLQKNVEIFNAATMILTAGLIPADPFLGIMLV